MPKIPAEQISPWDLVAESSSAVSSTNRPKLRTRSASCGVIERSSDRALSGHLHEDADTLGQGGHFPAAYLSCARQPREVARPRSRQLDLEARRGPAPATGVTRRTRAS